MVGMIVKGTVKDTLENSIFRESKEASISGPDLEIKGKVSKWMKYQTDIDCLRYRYGFSIRYGISLVVGLTSIDDTTSI